MASVSLDFGWLLGFVRILGFLFVGGLRHSKCRLYLGILRFRMVVGLRRPRWRPYRIVVFIVGAATTTRARSVVNVIRGGSKMASVSYCCFYRGSSNDDKGEDGGERYSRRIVGWLGWILYVSAATVMYFFVDGGELLFNFWRVVISCIGWWAKRWWGCCGKLVVSC